MTHKFLSEEHLVFFCAGNDLALQNARSSALLQKSTLSTTIRGEKNMVCWTGFFVVKHSDTVDGWNPAPPGMYKTL